MSGSAYEFDMRGEVVSAFANTAIEMLAYADGYLDAPGKSSGVDIGAAMDARKTILDGMRRNLGPSLYAEFIRSWSLGRARLKERMEAEEAL